MLLRATSAHCILTTYQCFTSVSSYCRPDMEQKAVSKPQVVPAPQPRAATADSFAQAIWAPQPTRSSSTAAFGQTDMAAQIRAKFENLVRASPLPKASLPSFLVYNVQGWCMPLFM